MFKYYIIAEFTLSTCAYPLPSETPLFFTYAVDNS